MNNLISRQAMSWEAVGALGKTKDDIHFGFRLCY